MPHEEQNFLEAVFGPDDSSPAEAPVEPAGEPADPREAYLPDVVRPRIRQALRGGHGLAGSPRRYGAIVALLVGLASVPTWFVLRAGMADVSPALSEPTGQFLVAPADRAVIVAPPALAAAAQGRVSGPAAQQVIPVRQRATVVARVAEPAVRVPERAAVARPAHSRPVRHAHAHAHATRPVAHRHTPTDRPVWTVPAWRPAGFLPPRLPVIGMPFWGWGAWTPASFPVISAHTHAHAAHGNCRHHHRTVKRAR